MFNYRHPFQQYNHPCSKIEKILLDDNCKQWTKFRNGFLILKEMLGKIQIYRWEVVGISFCGTLYRASRIWLQKIINGWSHEWKNRKEQSPALSLMYAFGQQIAHPLPACWFLRLLDQLPEWHYHRAFHERETCTTQTNPRQQFWIGISISESDSNSKLAWAILIIAE